MITLTKCFSALVASGKGQACNEFKQRIQKEFLVIDPETQIMKSMLFKYGKKKFPEQQKKLSKDMGRIISSLIQEVDLFYFGPDLQSNKSEPTKEETDVLAK